MQADPQRARSICTASPTPKPSAADLANRLDDFFARYADPQYDIWHGGRSKANRVTQ